MKVILLKDTPKIGKRFDVKDVSDGHATNFLIPRGFAIAGTPEALKRYELERAKAEGEKRIQGELIEKNIKELSDITLKVIAKANEKGHLFASLHKEEIAAELTKQTRIQIDPSFIVLDHPIKETGEHTIEVKGGGKTGKFKLVVEGKSK